VNVHLTGCHHSCAQHYIGDIGLQATKVEVGDDTVEGYHLCVGGGYADLQGVGRMLFDSLPFDEVPATVERLLCFYLDRRFGPSESFAEFTRRFELEELREAIRGYALV
jgi:ferredoxin-nitrite reductase